MRRISEHDLKLLTQGLSQKDDFVFLESSKISDRNHSSLLFTDPIEWLVCTAEDSPASYLEALEQHRSQGKYLAGWIAYEFGYLLEPTLHHFLLSSGRYRLSERPLAVLGVFEQPIVFDHSTSLSLSDGHWPLLDNTGDEEFTITNMQTNIAHDQYLSAINRIKQYIIAVIPTRSITL